MPVSGCFESTYEKQEIFMWQQISSTVITEMLANYKPIDGVVFDLEHGCFNDESLYASIQICSNMKKKALVRLPYLDKGRLRMCLDAGVDGVILSTVETKKQAQEFLDQCLYSRKRGQGLTRQNFWNDNMLYEGRIHLDKNLLIIPQIETAKGVKNIDKIMDKRFDYYMVGPYDLSASFKSPGNFQHVDFKIAMSLLERKLGRKLGMHLVKDVKAEKIKEHNHCGMLALGMDTLFVMEGIDKCIKAL